MACRAALVNVAAAAILIGGCTGASPELHVSQRPASAAISMSAAPSASPSVTLRAVSLLLPLQLHGVELHTFAVGHDSVTRLLELLEANPADLEIAYASEHGSRFLQMFALRVAGTDGEALLEAFAQAAYDPAAGEITRSGERVAGVAVSVVSQQASAERLGTFYLLVREGALIAVQAFERQIAEEGLRALP